ncbi:hypothetical protein MPSEU_000353100 [Mayamaea pseudoterrestris]|nr:hypothetical protein MPSEU_000353100 [Mayamaea pseudoterrestris]
MANPRPRKQPFLLSICAFASVQIVTVPVDAFIAPQLLFQARFDVTSSFSLTATRPSKLSPKSNKNKKAAKTKTAPAKKSDNKNAYKPAAAPKRQARVPPWQVLSSKDAAQNIQNEIERRQLVQQGVIPSHQETASSQSKDKKQSAASSQLSKSFLSPAQQQFCNWKRVSPFTTPLRLRFLGAHLESKTLPPSMGTPEVAFLGRSNVGKSSLLNRLSSMSASDSSGSATRQAVARVGQTPGATASVNFYALTQQNDRNWMTFVDLPGYGYAKLSRDRQAAIQQVAEDYLQKRKELCLGILLVDARRVPTTDDCSVLAALFDMGLPILVVATKRDKLSSNELTVQLERIRNELGLPEGQPLCVSSVTGDGCKDLWKIILEASESAVRDFNSRYEGGEAKAVDNDEDLGNDDADWYDGEETMYSQGYDWIHGNDANVMLEDEDDYEDYADAAESDASAELVDEDDDAPAIQRETLKSLRKRARGMERRGEV